MTTLDTIRAALIAYGVHPYRDESSYPLSRAQRALRGRSHYVDDDTIKYFEARINSCHVDYNGLYFYILESVVHPSRGRVHRAVVFDVFGTVLNDRGEDHLHKRSDGARRSLDVFLRTFDPLAHTEAALCARLKRDQARIVETLRILGE